MLLLFACVVNQARNEGSHVEILFPFINNVEINSLLVVVVLEGFGVRPSLVAGVRGLHIIEDGDDFSPGFKHERKLRQTPR